MRLACARFRGGCPVRRRLPDSVAVAGMTESIPQIPTGPLGGGYPVQWWLPARTGRSRGRLTPHWVAITRSSGGYPQERADSTAVRHPVRRRLPDSGAFSPNRWRLHRHLTTPTAAQSGNRHAGGKPQHGGQEQAQGQEEARWRDQTRWRAKTTHARNGALPNRHARNATRPNRRTSRLEIGRAHV